MNRRSLFSFLGTLPVAGVGALAAVVAEQPSEPNGPGGNLHFCAGASGVVEWHTDENVMRLAKNGLWVKEGDGPWKRVV